MNAFDLIARRFLCLLLGALTAACGLAATPADDIARQIRLPIGFEITTWAEVPNPRQMSLGADGVLYVGSRSSGAVHAVRFDKDFKALSVSTVAKNIAMPVGVAWHDGDLYVSAVGRILRLRDIDRRIDSPPAPEVVTDAFPDDTHHGWKFIAFGPDGKLYVPVGAPCNICDRDAEGYANIMRMNADGSALEVYARGVRNSVGFDWNPVNHKLWFTDNGRDWLGDDQPPCELNFAPRAGMHFGYPFCHGGDIADPEFGAAHACSEFTPPAQKLGPHVAPLGMRFYSGTQFPAEYRNAIFIAEHGSWNRSRPIGYRVTVVKLDGDKAISYKPFAEGWLTDSGQVLGRPADVLVLPDGSLLVADDKADVIWRIRYRA